MYIWYKIYNKLWFSQEIKKKILLLIIVNTLMDLALLPQADSGKIYSQKWIL